MEMLLCACVALTSGSQFTRQKSKVTTMEAVSKSISHTLILQKHKH
jgi:hypothetical protein